MASTCSPACTGATPVCNADLQCVACAVDTDCLLGQICTRQGKVSACVTGCTDDSRCPNPGGGGVAHCCGGQCTDVQSDPRNCGSCAAACTVLQGTASCTAGACGVGGCDQGWADCNNDPADGCEVEVATDPDNCTACGKVCTIVNAVPACSNACYIRACDFGTDDCNSDVTDGCETSTVSDKLNCGSCGNSCKGEPHATVDCQNAACAVTGCQAGFADCDGNTGNGCEVQVATDNANCGTCGTVCKNGLVCKNGGCTCAMCNFPHATSTCLNMVCAIDKCNAGWGDCDGVAKNGCEAAMTSDSSNCGACGMVCGNGEVCIKGLCSITTCGDGKLQGDEEVDPPPGPFMSVMVDAFTCRWDLSMVTQLYCNGACSWAGAIDCDQADADIFCKLRTGNPLSTANSFGHAQASNDPGFACPLGFGVNIGPLPTRGVNQAVPYQDSSILANHGAGNVIVNPDCTDP